MAERILVTGGSGFIAGHTILALLRKNYQVRISVRDPAKVKPVADLVSSQGLAVQDMDYAVADLGSDDGWAEAVSGCDGVFHMASPFPFEMPKDPQDLIRPAREGTLRVLKAAADAGIRRTVLTSSIASVAYGRGGRETLFTEDDWTDPDGKGAGAYVQSKTIAEKAAWDFVRDAGLELNSINPGLVVGPVLSKSHGTSVDIIRQLMTGEIPAIPPVGFNLIDVRDVAEAHIRAYELPGAGERFICADRWLWMTEAVDILKAAFPDRAKKLPSFKSPAFAIRLMSIFDSSVSAIVDELNQKRAVDNSKLKTVLGMTPISTEDALKATGQTLINLGII